MTSKRKVIQTVMGIPATDGAGVKLTRIIGSPELNMADPFLLLDFFASDNPDDYIAGFPSHPHRGFETVTYLLNGRMRHKDSTGREGVIEAGGVQWMTAGSGIIHSEMPEQENGLLQGFQLWVNLPADKKMSPPVYQEFDPESIPVEKRGEHTAIRVIAGQTRQGTRGPVTGIAAQPTYMDISINGKQAFTERVAAHNTVFLYIIEGQIEIAGTVLQQKQLAVLGDGETIDLQSKADSSRFLLLAAKKLNEPVARGGPFVMNTRQEVLQAFHDYQQGKLVA